MNSSHVDHDHQVPEATPLSDNPIWRQDNVTLKSIGIDIGTSVSQIVVSEVAMRRASEFLSSRYEVTGRNVVYESLLSFTPYSTDGMIDVDLLQDLITSAVDSCHIDQRDIDTGVIILTGEAQVGENSHAIAKQIAAMFDSIVCVSAGHEMEAVLAAHGSGAVRRSRFEDSTIFNVDIGGGTTKLSVIIGGEVVATAAVHVGARLLTFHEHGRIAQFSVAGTDHLRNAGLPFDLDHRYTSEEKAILAKSMVREIVSTLNDSHDQPSPFLLTAALPHIESSDGIIFSGGVAEYVYERESRDFGDLGPLLGSELRDWLCGDPHGMELLPPGECIRATALGAAQDTVQLSGTTVFVTSSDLIPRRNLRIVKPKLESISDDAISSAIDREIRRYGLSATDPDVALAFNWDFGPEYHGLWELAKGIRSIFRDRFAREIVTYVLIDEDCGMTLGRILKDELRVQAEIVVLDGFDVTAFSWVDIGTPRDGSGAIPVTIKSLVFDKMRGLPNATPTRV